jgi:predicted nucleic-acid-binding Zn-ribbon protein
MVVLYIKCVKCSNNKYVCNSIYFQHNFTKWTSNNNEIDKFIQSTQLSDHNYYGCQALEWIPYNRFYNVKYIAKGGFSEVYRANWIDGHINGWDSNHQIWNRKDQNMFVALKKLNNSKNVTFGFMNEVNYLIIT